MKKTYEKTVFRFFKILKDTRYIAYRVMTIKTLPEQSKLDRFQKLHRTFNGLVSNLPSDHAKGMLNPARTLAMILLVSSSSGLNNSQVFERVG
jgi:hypothetical protein